jgi:hypothetical protein
LASRLWLGTAQLGDCFFVAEILCPFAYGRTYFVGIGRASWLINQDLADVKYSFLSLNPD